MLLSLKKTVVWSGKPLEMHGFEPSTEGGYLTVHNTDAGNLIIKDVKPSASGTEEFVIAVFNRHGWEYWTAEPWGKK